MSDFSINKQLLLIGAGHAHLEVMRQLMRQPLPSNWSVTLVSPDRFAYYSGMLSGYLIGLYRIDDIRIDLLDFLKKGQIKFVVDQMKSISISEKKVELGSGEKLHFDLVSFDIGSQPTDLSKSSLNILPVKPIAEFLRGWGELIEKLKLWGASSSPRVAIIGGGASGVELALALARIVEKFRSRPVLSLWDENRLLSGWPARAGRIVRRELERFHVRLRLGTKIEAIHGEEIAFRSLTDRSREGGGRGANNEGKELADFVILATQAKAATFLGDSGLSLDEFGFVRVNEKLQAIGHSKIYAVGDCARLPIPVAKAGVYAVRQGPILAKNLMATMNGEEKLASYQPQKNFMILLTLGRRSALFAKGKWALASPLFWRWKDLIDRSFVKKYKT